MSQRMKARSMVSAAGHGDQLKHVTTRIGAPAGVMAGTPNQVADSGSMGVSPPAAPSMAVDPDAGMD